jgi:hypothetical protein
MNAQPITPAFIGPRFPSFYSECAYLDGARGLPADSYTPHGEPEPIGMRWYRAGQMSRITPSSVQRIARLYEVWVGYNPIKECGLTAHEALQALREYRAEAGAA